MNRKATLVLMEQLIMVPVFALASALCLLVFSKSTAISDRTAHRDAAVLIAQNTAELLKSGIDPETISHSEDYTVVITPQNTDIPGLAQAEILVSHQDQPLYTLTVGWQEVAP